MNKLTKLLSVFVIAGAVGTSIVGVAGCKKDKNQHSHSITTWENNLDGTHDGKCSCGEIMVDDEVHVYENDECIKCHAPENEVVPGNVSFNTTSNSSGVGREFTIVATISNAAALSDDLKVLTWEVEDPTVASITVSADTATATVKCLKVGTTTITAETINHNKATFNLSVTNDATDVRITDAEGKAIDRIALTPTSGDITINAVILPEGSTDTEVVWESSNTAIATVMADAANPNKAVVHMVAQGDTPILITATVKGKNVKKSIFCTADTYYGELVNDTENLIINENFSKYNTGDVVEEWSGSWGTAGVYGAFAQHKDDTVQGHYGLDEAGNGNALKIVTEESNNNNNRAEMIDTSDSGTHVVVDFGAVDGVVKGYTNIKIVNYANSWTFAQFYGADKTKPTGGEIFGLRSDGGILKYRLDGGSVQTGKTTVNLSAGTSLRLYYEIDIQADTVKVYVNGELFADIAANTLGITDLYGLKFVSGDGNTGSKGNPNLKTISVDNIAVTHVGLTVDAHRTDLLARLDTEYAKYTEADYTSANWTTLTGHYNTAKTAINGATDKETMNTAYDTAVAEMKKLPTIAGQALYEAKEAYKAEIAETYPEASYTYNATAYATAKAAVISAIDAYSGEAAGLKADATVVAKVAALAAVKTDAQAMAAAKEAYKAEIAETYPEASYTMNATAYKSAYDAVIAAIENYSGAIDGIKTDATISGLVTTLAAVKTDAQELEAAKAAAKKEISEYKKAEIDALATAAEGTAEATVYKDIQGVIARRTGAVDTASTIDGEQGVNWNVEEAKQNIDSLLNSLKKTIEEVRADELALLKAEYDNAVSKHDDIKAHLDKVYNSAVTNINNETDKTAVTNIRIAATTELNVVIAKDAAYKEIVAHANEVKADLHSESAKADIDKEIMYDLNSILTATPDPSGWSAHMWAIHNSTVISGELADGTKVGVTVAKQVVLDKIDDIAEQAKAATYEVSLGDTGEKMTVKYGTELKLGDLLVTAKKVTSATYNGEPITDENGVIVYDDIEISVVVVDIEGFVPSVEHRPTADATDVVNLFTSALVDVTSNGIEKSQATSRTIDGTSFTTSWASYNIAALKDKETGVANEIHDNKATPIIIKVKQSLSTLKVYATLADSAGTGNNRAGTIYAVINGGEPIAIKSLQSTGNMSVAWTPEVSLRPGDEIQIYAVNTTDTSGARLHLFGVDAAIDESKVSEDVSITWGEGSTAETYHYYDGVVLPATPVDPNGGAFIGWYYTPAGGAETQITEGMKFPSGTVIVATAKFATANVTVNYTVDGETKQAKFYVADGEQGITIADPVKDGFKFLHWVETGTENVVDLTTITAGNYDITAVFEEITEITDAIDISGDTNTSGHAFTFKSEKEYFTIANSGNYKYSSVLGGALIGTSSGRGLVITTGQNFTSITITLQLGISADSKYNDSSKGSSANVTGAITETITSDSGSNVYEYTVTLKPGETITIKGVSNLALVGATAVVTP